jgi:thiamine-monophosphate kinase
LSDIAAMGAEPRFCLLSLALAPWTDARWFNAFLGGFFRLARRAGTPLVGGDLAPADAEGILLRLKEAGFAGVILQQD